MYDSNRVDGQRTADTTTIEQLTLRETKDCFGGRCWDGPLGDRRECPPKPSSGGGSFVTVFFLLL